MFTTTTVLMFDLSDPARSEDLAHVVRQDPTVRQAVVVERTQRAQSQVTVSSGGYRRSLFSQPDAVTAFIGSAQQKG